MMITKRIQRKSKNLECSNTTITMNITITMKNKSMSMLNTNKRNLSILIMPVAESKRTKICQSKAATPLLLKIPNRKSKHHQLLRVDKAAKSARNAVPTKRDHMTLTTEAEATSEEVTIEETTAAEKETSAVEKETSAVERETIAIVEEVVSTTAAAEETGKTAEVAIIKTESREPRILTSSSRVVMPLKTPTTSM